MLEEYEDISETLNRVLEVATRRRWWVILPAFVVAMATCLGSRLQPNRYQSEAIVYADWQQGPERSDIWEALQGRAEPVLSRARLLQIIDETGLYAKERKKLAPEELVELMRSNIAIAPTKKNPDEIDPRVYKISFTCNDPRAAQEVAGKLAALFVAASATSPGEQPAADLEKPQPRSQVRLIDPPSLPRRPSGPDRAKYNLCGLVAGLALGALLAFVAELRDHSFRDDNDIRRRFPVPLVVSLPLLLTEAERRRRSRLKALEWFAAFTLGLIVCAAEFYVLRRG